MSDHDADTDQLVVLDLLGVEVGAAPAALQTVSVGRDPSPRRLRWLGSFACLLVVLGAVAVVAKGGEEDEDGGARLAAAQAALAGSSSYTYELRQTSHVRTGDPDGAGSDVTNRTLTVGTVAAHDRWHVIDDSGDDFFAPGESEVIRVGDQLFAKSGFDSAPAGVDAPAWIAGPVGDPMGIEDYVEMYSFVGEEELDGSLEAFEDEALAFEAQWRLELVLGAYLLPVQDDPANLHRLVDDAAEPTVEEHLPEGGTRLRTTLAPIPELAEVSDEDLEPVDLVLDLGADDLPIAARFSVAAEAASSTVEVQFSDWGGDLVVEAPAASDVDQTPWIAEEALSALEPGVLVAPTELPDGMALSGVDVVEWDEGCYELGLNYSHEAERMIGPDLSDDEFAELWAGLPYLSITVTTRACAEEFDDAPFEDTVAGRPSRGSSDYLEVLMGDAVVSIDNDLSPEELAELVSSLRPTDAEQLSAAIPEWARAWATEGWGFAVNSIAVS